MKRKDTYPGVIENKAVHEVATIMPELVLIDVRTPAEFEARHIPGSHNIPLDQVPFYKDEIAQAAGNACLLLICQSGARARKAAEVLQAASLTSMTILEGGIAAWEKAGKPLRQGRQKWSLERQGRGGHAGAPGSAGRPVRLETAHLDLGPGWRWARLFRRFQYLRHGRGAQQASLSP